MGRCLRPSEKYFSGLEKSFVGVVGSPTEAIKYYKIYACRVMHILSTEICTGIYTGYPQVIANK
jgi:hypothetical protein